jgi:glycosyltransferase involved in cell wall biosynthesis
MKTSVQPQWQRGRAPVAVVMISLNEAHNMEAVLHNLQGWAQEVFLVDSCSVDTTVDIALRHGVHVVQRRFRGFGDQWNFALRSLPITAPWTMKLDPDERLTDELKRSIETRVSEQGVSGIEVNRRLWFMGFVLPVQQRILRVWRSGTCVFSDVPVNEHPLLQGCVDRAEGYLEHHDSPDLDHWIRKQNKYTTAEAINQFRGGGLAASPRLFGNALERRMWIKKNFWRVPGRYLMLFAYHLWIVKAWRTGRIGWIWAHLRTEVYRLWEFKRRELDYLNRIPEEIPSGTGAPDVRVRLHE